MPAPDASLPSHAGADLEAIILGVLNLAPGHAFSPTALRDAVAAVWLHRERIVEALEALRARGAVRLAGDGRYTASGAAIASVPGPRPPAGTGGQAEAGDDEFRILAVLPTQDQEKIDFPELASRLVAFNRRDVNEAEVKKILDAMVSASRVRKDGDCYWRPVSRSPRAAAAAGAVNFFPEVGDCVEWITGGGFGRVDRRDTDGYCHVVFNPDPRTPFPEDHWIYYRELGPAPGRCL